jgi:hypothetical protein
MESKLILKALKAPDLLCREHSICTRLLIDPLRKRSVSATSNHATCSVLAVRFDLYAGKRCGLLVPGHRGSEGADCADLGDARVNRIGAP